MTVVEALDDLCLSHTRCVVYDGIIGFWRTAQHEYTPVLYYSYYTTLLLLGREH